MCFSWMFPLCVCVLAVPPNISELKNLEVLNMFNNQIEELPTQISSLQKLKHLNLGYVPLSISLHSYIKKQMHTPPPSFSVHMCNSNTVGSSYDQQCNCLITLFFLPSNTDFTFYLVLSCGCNSSTPESFWCFLSMFVVERYLYLSLSSVSPHVVLAFSRLQHILSRNPFHLTNLVQDTAKYFVTDCK